MGVASLSYGQGLVSFANQTTTKISTNGTVQATAASGTWYYALFQAPSTRNTLTSTSLDPLADGWTLVAIGTNTTAGRLSGNTTTEGVSVTPSANQVNDYAVAGWSGSIGTTWAQVEQFFNTAGQTNQMTQASHDSGAFAANGGWFAIAPTVGNDVNSQPSGSAINSVFSSSGVAGFSLGFINPAPEPTSFALIGLGGAALMIFRRQK